MWLLKNPHDYDILVAENLFGDIVSDLAAQLVGGLGFACSGNIGDTYGVFEPTHGSAPKYSGMYKVNPIATILAAKMMLDWIGEIGQGRGHRRGRRRRHQGREGPDLRHGRVVDKPRRRPGRRRQALTSHDRPGGRHDDAERLGGPPPRTASSSGEVNLESPSTHSARLLRSIDFLLGAHGCRYRGGRRLRRGRRARARSPASASVSAPSSLWPSPRENPSPPVSTLEALAAKIVSPPVRLACPLLDAKKGEIYAALFEAPGGAARRDHPPRRLRPRRVLRPASRPPGHRLHRERPRPLTGRSSSVCQGQGALPARARRSSPPRSAGSAAG